MVTVSARDAPVGLGMVKVAPVTPQLCATAPSHANAWITTCCGSGLRVFSPSGNRLIASVDEPLSSTESRRIGTPVVVVTAKPITVMPLGSVRSEEHTSELQSLAYLVC